MRVKNMNFEKLKNGGLKLCAGVIITGVMIAGSLVLIDNVQDNEIERVPVVVNFQNTEYMNEDDVISFVNEDNNVVGVAQSNRGHETTVIPGENYSIRSYLLDKDGVEIFVPEDEDGFSVNVDYESETVTVEGLGRGK